MGECECGEELEVCGSPASGSGVPRAYLMVLMSILGEFRPLSLAPRFSLFPVMLRAGWLY
jgi:hypothetical protein